MFSGIKKFIWLSQAKFENLGRNWKKLIEIFKITLVSGNWIIEYFAKKLKKTVNLT